MKRLAVVFLFSAAALRAAALDLYISSSGSDANPGSKSAPFATIIRARDAIRSIRKKRGLPEGGVTVWLQGGYYDQTNSVAFDFRDSGTRTQPIIYSGSPGAQVFITGASRLDPPWFARLNESSSAWPRLDLAARGNVYSANLRIHGMTDYGTIKSGGFLASSVAALEIFQGGRPLTLARWPNVGQPFARTVSAASATRIIYSGARPRRWTRASEPWLHGLWGTNWADFHVRVASINTSANEIDLSEPPSQFGIEANRPYYAYNLLEEIDEPGEYYLDRNSGELYLWPMGPLADSPIQASMVEGCLVRLECTEYVTLRNLTLEVARGPLLQINSGDHNGAVGCLFRNCGEYAAEISGSDNGLDQCEIVDCGEEGVLLEGGSRSTLTAGNNYVTNSRIHRIGRINWTYHPAINLKGGCGNIASHNLIDDLPHLAVMFSGNNHVIEFNEISRVCEHTSDAGAIYSGRDWGYRGNIIRNNFIHNVRSDLLGVGTNGVYLDDFVSGTQVIGNVFYEISGAAIFCGGGRDNIMSNNVIARCGMGHYNGDYSRAKINNTADSTFNLLERLSEDGIQYQAGVWASAYPNCAAIPNSWNEIQHGLWRNPQNCVFSSNVGWSNKVWTYETDVSVTGVFSVYAAIRDNDPDYSALFDEAASWDRSQRPAQLSASVAGFNPIPFGSIGPSILKPPQATLAPPAQSIECLNVTDIGADLQWSDDGRLPMQKETRFALQEQIGTGDPWRTIRTFGPDVDFASVYDLAPDERYSFRVQATNDAGSSYSNILSLKTMKTPLVPGDATRFEAESPLNVINSVGHRGAVAVVNSTLVSGKCVSLFDPGDAIRITFTAPATGIYRIGVRLKAGDSNLPLGTIYWPDGYGFVLDGHEIKFVGDPTTLSAFSHSLGPTYWGTTYSENIPIAAGAHSVDIIDKRSWGAVDYLELAPMVEPQNHHAPSQ